MSKNLREFLNYFGSFFDPQAVMIDNLQLNNVHNLMDPMTVVDPLNKMNNVTKSAFRIRDIQVVFQDAYQLIVTNEKPF